MENQPTKLKKDKIDKFFSASERYEKKQKIKKESILFKKHTLKFCVGFAIIIIAGIFFVAKESGKEKKEIAAKADNQQALALGDTSKVNEEPEISSLEEKIENKKEIEDNNLNEVSVGVDKKIGEDELKNKLEEEKAKEELKAEKKEQSKAREEESEKIEDQLAKEKKLKEDEKKVRQDKANKVSSQLSDASKEISEEMADLTGEINELNQKISNIYKLSVSIAVINGKVAPLESQLKSLQNSSSSLSQARSKISSILSALNSYSNYDMPLSSSDISFLSSLGISF